MKAKFILLDTYKINPEPYVVELDEHPLGDKLQAALAETTGRKTVPNILIQGRSIGGGDDINHLHEAGELRNTIIDMGGSRIVAVSLKAGSRQERVMRV
jgi:glutaredoxin